MTLIFNTKQDYFMMHICCQFGASSSNLLKVIVWTSQIFKNSTSKWPIWHWRSKSMTSIFNTKREYPRMHVWCKFGDSSSNLWRVIERTKKSLRTDGRTDGQTEAGNDNTPSAWKAKRWYATSCKSNLVGQYAAAVNGTLSVWTLSRNLISVEIYAAWINI